MEAGALAAEQRRLAELRPVLWRPEPPLSVAAAVVVGGRGAHDAEGARLWAAAALRRASGELVSCLVEDTVRSPYVPGSLAAREGPLLAAAVAGLATRPDVLLVAAAGRDHPRRAGLALHLGAVLDLPTVGLTDHPLLATGAAPGPGHGDTSPLLLDGAEVGRWVRTAPGARPVVAHAAWRTTAAAAAGVVLAATTGARTPQPLREARALARRARASRRVP